MNSCGSNQVPPKYLSVSVMYRMREKQEEQEEQEEKHVRKLYKKNIVLENSTRIHVHKHHHHQNIQKARQTETEKHAHTHRLYTQRQIMEYFFSFPRNCSNFEIAWLKRINTK